MTWKSYLIKNEGIVMERLVVIRTVPTLILVDDEGNVVKRHSGLLGIQELKEFYNEAD